MKSYFKEKEVYYPVLLFVVMSAFNGTRGTEDSLVMGVGRNAVWFPFVGFLLAIMGLLAAFAISRQAKGDSLMLASGRIGPSFLTPLSYLLYTVLFWGGAAFIIIGGGDFFSRTLLYGDQSKLILIMIIILVVFSFLPMDTLGRYAHIVLLFVFPIFLIIDLTKIPLIHWSYLYPPVSFKSWDAIR